MLKVIKEDARRLRSEFTSKLKNDEIRELVCYVLSLSRRKTLARTD
jgi:hypothetical protein